MVGKINLLFLIVWNMIAGLYRRFVYGKAYKASRIQRISPFASVIIRENGKINFDHNIAVSSGCVIESIGTGNISIGKRTYFNRGCMISSHESVSIGEDCLFGPDVKIYDNDHCYGREEGVSHDLKKSSVSIGDRCWIASNVVMLRGTEIGDRCVIGAGCVVKGKIPAGSVVKLKQSIEII